jgi:hypothetical protein
MMPSHLVQITVGIAAAVSGAAMTFHQFGFALLVGGCGIALLVIGPRE